MLGVCCVISETYHAYLAGIFNSFCKVTLYVEKTKSPILEPLFRRNQNFAIGPFEFELKVEKAPECTFNDVTSGDIKFLFKIIAIDSWIKCGPRACLNFTEFIWNNLGIFSFKLYALFAAPFDPSPKILHPQHHRAGSDGWKSDFLSDIYFDEFKTALAPVVSSGSHGESCICNVGLRQPSILKGSASHVLFHLTFNVVQFALTNRTLYEQYRYAVQSNIVPP